MKLTWHIFLKDLRNLRAPLAFWLILLGAEVFCNGWALSPAGVDDGWFTRTGMFANLFAIANLVVSYLLIAGLVLEDPLVGTSMFWATRPISGARLLGAKLLGVVLLFGVVPSLVRLPLWLYCGFGWEGLAYSLGRTWLHLALATVPAMTLAALAGQANRFTLYSILTVAAVPTVLLIATQSFRLPAPDLGEARTWVGVSVCLLGGIAAMVCHYLTRRLTVAVTVLAVGVGLGGIGLFAWPWVPEDFQARAVDQLAAADGVATEIVDASVVDPRFRSDPSLRALDVRFLVRGIPADLALLDGKGEMELRWPDGTVMRGERLRVWPRQGNDNAVRRALAMPVRQNATEAKGPASERIARMEARFGQSRFPIPLESDECVMVIRLVVEEPQAKRIVSDPPACEVTVRLAIRQADLLLELPLVAGGKRAGKNVRLHLLDTHRLRSGDATAARQADRLRVTASWALPPGPRPQTYLLDRSLGMLRETGVGYSHLPVLGGVTPVGRVIEWPPIPQSRQDGGLADIPGWESRQSFAVVKFPKVGGIDREMRVERLKVGFDAW